MTDRWLLILILLALACLALVMAWAIVNSETVRDDCVRFTEQRPDLEGCR